MNRFPVLERLTVSNFRMFPGSPKSPGIDFRFQGGISVLAGVNGLGKTTLINLLFRLLVGPFDLPKDSASAKFGSAAKANVVSWPGRNTYFPQRVADRAQSASAELWFKLGHSQFSVRRSLSTLKLQSCTFNGENLEISGNEQAYRDSICVAANAGQFVDFLTAIKYLTFFNEERRDILWDGQAQRQFFRILFTTPEEAREWIELEQQISSADSRARNMSNSVYQLEQDLNEGEKLLVSNAGVDARLSAEQTLLDTELRRRRELELHAERLDEDLKRIRRDLERSKLNEDLARRSVEETRFARLGRLFPNLTETARYILTQLYADGRCLACERESPQAQQRLEHAVESSLCVVCGSDLTAAQRLLENAESEDDFEEAIERLSLASLQRRSLADEERSRDQEWQEVLKELGDLTASANARIKKVEALRSQLPPDPEDLSKLRSSILELREREDIEKRKRQSAEAVYDRLLTRVSERIQTATSTVSGYFQELIGCFLEEESKLSFKTINDRPSQSGRIFRYPSLRFEMTAAAFDGEQIRSSPDDVSESQREFIDLAFRMALAEAAAIDGEITMVIETPGASLDAVYMERAANLLCTFARDPRSIVVTSNLTSSVMIPALLGPETNDQDEIEERRKRVLNLLDVAAPNAAVRYHKRQYSDFLEAGLRGRRV